MVRVVIQDQEMDQMEKDIQQWMASMPKRIQDIQQKFYTNVRELTPVDTGYMKSQWRKEPVHPDFSSGKGRWVGVVSNTTPYLPYVNEGHYTSNYRSYVPGQYFVQRALALTRTQIQEILKP